MFSFQISTQTIKKKNLPYNDSPKRLRNLKSVAQTTFKSDMHEIGFLPGVQQNANTHYGSILWEVQI